MSKIAIKIMMMNNRMNHKFKNNKTKKYKIKIILNKFVMKKISVIQFSSLIKRRSYC